MKFLIAGSLALLLAICPATLCSQPSSDDSNDPPDTLRVGFYEIPPFVIRDSTRLYGLSLWLWEQISEREDLPYELVELPLPELIKGLEQDSLDLSLVPLTITSDRSERIDYSPPFYLAHATVMIRSVSTWEQALRFMGSFFSWNFIRALGALFVVIFIFGFLAWMFERKANAEEFGDGMRGIANGIWWSAVTMTTVGYGDKSPRTPGGRIVGLIWMFVAIIIISGFTASITSSLTLDQMSWNQNGIHDFKERDLGTVKTSATEAWLVNQYFRRVRGENNVAEAVAALRNREVEAVAYDAPLLHYLLQQNPGQEFEILPIRFNPQWYAFGFSEALPMERQEQISNQLLQVIESADWKVRQAEFGLIDDNSSR